MRHMFCSIIIVFNAMIMSPYCAVYSLTSGNGHFFISLLEIEWSGTTFVLMSIGRVMCACVWCVCGVFNV